MSPLEISLSGAPHNSPPSIEAFAFDGLANSNDEPTKIEVTSSDIDQYGGEGSTWQSYPVTANANLPTPTEINVTSIITTDTITIISFIGEPLTQYTCKASPNLQNFNTITTTPSTITTNNQGLAQFSVPFTDPKIFYQIEPTEVP